MLCLQTLDRLHVHLKRCIANRIAESKSQCCMCRVRGGTRWLPSKAPWLRCETPLQPRQHGHSRQLFVGNNDLLHYVHVLTSSTSNFALMLRTNTTAILVSLRH